MKLDQLFESLYTFGPLPSSLLDKHYIARLKQYLNDIISFSIYNQRQLILSSGQISDHIYFVEKGLARGFYTDQITLKERTNFLWNDHCFIAEPTSFYHRKPSSISIEVTPVTELLGISYQQLMACGALFPEADAYMRNLLLQHNAVLDKKNSDFSTLSAMDRFKQLLQTHPNIEQQVSQSVIASYLNITPQSLSRLLRQKKHP